MTQSVPGIRIFCPECDTQTDYNPHQYCCSCGGAWEPCEERDFPINAIDISQFCVWRYQRIFGLASLGAPITLGAGWTPLLKTDWYGGQALMKMEYLSPTGSFKDRGTEVEMNILSAMGVHKVVEDSSGNAGASLAAYAARLNMQAEVYTPQDASPAKLAQISVFGARLVTVPGERMEACRAVMRAVERGAVYASHAYNPFYLLGQQSIAWEIWEQLGRNALDAMVIPVGQGGLLMGAWLGFKRLLQNGHITQMPRLFAAQPERLAPIAKAWQAGLIDIPPAQAVEKSIAEGLAITRPVRARRIMQALRESGGQGLTVTEKEIIEAYGELAQKGFFVEPSSAVAAAVFHQVLQFTRPDATIVVTLTGSGLKSPHCERKNGN